MNLEHRCIIVPANQAEFAAALTAAASPAGAGMFIAALGTEEITHRFSNGPIGEEFAAILPLDEWDDEEAAYVRVSEGNAEAIAAMGAPLEAVQALLSAAVVTDEDWRVTSARLGLVYWEMA